MPVYRPSLARRLTRLENKLQIDPEKPHKCMGWLKKPDVKVIAGVRIRDGKRKGEARRSSLTPLNADRPSRSSSASSVDEAKSDLKGKGKESANEVSAVNPRGLLYSYLVSERQRGC